MHNATIKGALLGAFLLIIKRLKIVFLSKASHQPKYHKAQIIERICSAMIIVILLQSLKLWPLHTLIFYQTLIPSHLINLLVHLLCLTVVLILTRRGHLSWARHILLSSFCTYLTIACWLWGENTNLHFYFLLAMFVSCYIYGPSEKRCLIIWGSIQIALYVTATLTLPFNLNNESYPNGYIQGVRLTNSVVFAFSCCICAGFIQTITLRNWQQLHAFKENQDKLIRKIFPSDISQKLLKNDNARAYQQTRHLAVIFVDICGFTAIALHQQKNEMPSWQQIYALFSKFDQALAHLDSTRIKVNGDQYIVVMGLQSISCSHADISVQALEASTTLQHVSSIPIKQGLAFGPITYGVFDTHRPHFDIWGETVILASRLEALALKNEILCNDLIHRLSARPERFKLSNKLLKGMGYRNIYSYCNSNSSDE